MRYWLHDPEDLAVVLRLLELFVEDDVFAGQLEGGRQEVVLIGLLVILLIESAFELLEVLVEHVLPAEFEPPSEVVDPHVRHDTMLLEHPVHLLLLAPDDVPVIVPGLPPLTTHEAVVDAVLEGSLELYGRAEWGGGVRVQRVVLFFDVAAEVLTHRYQ